MTTSDQVNVSRLLVAESFFAIERLLASVDITPSEVLADLKDTPAAEGTYLSSLKHYLEGLIKRNYAHATDFSRYCLASALADNHTEEVTDAFPTSIQDFLKDTLSYELGAKLAARITAREEEKKAEAAANELYNFVSSVTNRLGRWGFERQKIIAMLPTGDEVPPAFDIVTKVLKVWNGKNSLRRLCEMHVQDAPEIPQKSELLRQFYISASLPIDELVNKVPFQRLASSDTLDWLNAGKHDDPVEYLRRKPIPPELLQWHARRLFSLSEKLARDESLLDTLASMLDGARLWRAEDQRTVSDFVYAMSNIWGVKRPKLRFVDTVEIKGNLGDAFHERRSGKTHFINRIAATNRGKGRSLSSIFNTAAHEFAHTVEAQIVDAAQGLLHKRVRDNDIAGEELKKSALLLYLDNAHYVTSEKHYVNYRRGFKERHANWVARNITTLLNDMAVWHGNGQKDKLASRLFIFPDGNMVDIHDVVNTPTQDWGKRFLRP